jgi:Ca2+-binding EF-hand superfamily protein
MNDFKVRISQEEARKLFDLFDEDDNGELSIDEFLHAVRGEMNEFRKSLVKKVFDKLDTDSSGFIDSVDIKKLYNARSHPDVKSG